MDTIFALASAPGRAGVAVIRISGPRAHEIAETLGNRGFPMRQATLCQLKDSDGALLDTGIIILFAENASFTGEKVAELQIHGSRASEAAVLRVLSQFNDARLAEPGEFTRRALLNGQMDLTEVEGLADLIDAETEIQRQQALEIMSGSLSGKVEAWRKILIEATSLVEVTIDFADEEVPVDVRPEVSRHLTYLRSEIISELSGIAAAERIRKGFEVAIVGPPNIGKSTLLNRLSQREAALVSDIPGTTRDVVEVRMDLGGLLVTFLDTAGLRQTNDVVETLGIKRAKDRARAADLRVILTDDGPSVMSPQTVDDIVLRGKGDLHPTCAVAVSGETGSGVPKLLANVSKILAGRAGKAGAATRQRHQQGLSVAIENLDCAIGRLDSLPEETDLLAEDLRRAIRGLESVTGRIDVEDVLDQVFSSFCLGK